MNKKFIFLLVLLLGYLTYNIAIYHLLIKLKTKQIQNNLLASIEFDISLHSLVLVTIIAIYIWGGIIYTSCNYTDNSDNKISLKSIYITGLLGLPFTYISLIMFIYGTTEPVTVTTMFIFAAILFVLLSKHIENKYR